MGGGQGMMRDGGGMGPGGEGMMGPGGEQGGANVGNHVFTTNLNHLVVSEIF